MWKYKKQLTESNSCSCLIYSCRCTSREHAVLHFPYSFFFYDESISILSGGCRWSYLRYKHSHWKTEMLPNSREEAKKQLSCGHAWPMQETSAFIIPTLQPVSLLEMSTLSHKSCTHDKISTIEVKHTPVSPSTFLHICLNFWYRNLKFKYKSKHKYAVVTKTEILLNNKMQINSETFKLSLKLYKTIEKHCVRVKIITKISITMFIDSHLLQSDVL